MDKMTPQKASYLLSSMATINLSYDEEKAVDYAAEILQKFADGKLIELPCKDGTEIFRITRNPKWDSHIPWRERNLPIQDRTPRKIITNSTFRLSDINEFGKTVFLTHAEAENSLSEKKG